MAVTLIDKRMFTPYRFSGLSTLRILILTGGVLMVLIINYNSRDQEEFESRPIHSIRENISNFHIISQNVRDLEHVGFPDLNDSDCLAAFNGSATNKNFRKTVRPWTYSRIMEDAKNCEYFREIYGMLRYPPPLKEEEEFPIAFSIVFHTDFDQVLYLLRAIYRPQNVYCLHVDKKSSQEMHAAVRAAVKCLPNVIIASKLEDVIYAGVSRLKADLTCMKDLLQLPVRWRYFINLVGQQFPLRSNLEIVRILKLFNGTNDIEGILGRRRLPQRFESKFGPIRDSSSGIVSMQMIGGTNPPPPHNLEVVKGSVFGTFSRAFVEFVIHDPLFADLLQWSKDVYSPDEYVWSTLHHTKKIKVPGGYTGKPDAKPWLSTYANWGEVKCHGIYVRSICILSAEDLPQLSQRHEFTANKFYITEYPAALHCLDQLIYNLTVSYTVRDLGFYKSLPFVNVH